MPFPDHPEKHTLASILTAEKLVAYRRQLGRLPFRRPPHGALFCLERSLPRRMRWRIPLRSLRGMNADVHETIWTPNPVAILTSFGGGAPILVELAEELAVMGAGKMLMMTWGGALQPGLRPGDILVCERAIRDDGVSRHYLPPDEYVEGDPALAAQLAEAIHRRGADCTIGSTWTTSAPFRETREEIRQYQSEGVGVVEMESAGLFTIGRVRAIPTASVVVVMDSLATLEWKPPERLDGIFRSLEVVYAACIDVLSRR